MVFIGFNHSVSILSIISAVKELSKFLEEHPNILPEEQNDKRKRQLVKTKVFKERKQRRQREEKKSSNLTKYWIFGFKKNSSCSHSLFVLSQVVDYFTQHGSSVNLASLHASKAFDRVHHVKLFNKLLARGFPGHIVKVLIDWYGKILSRVRWNGVFSRVESIRSGIRQGGILSPFLFMWTHSSQFWDHLILAVT